MAPRSTKGERASVKPTRSISAADEDALTMAPSVELRKLAEDAGEQWLQHHDPQWSEAQAISRPRGRSGRHRRARLPAGFVELGGGWLLPIQAESVRDKALTASILSRASGGQHPELETARRELVIEVIRETQEREPSIGRWWRSTLSFMLFVESCTPPRYRRSAKDVAEEMGRIWMALGPDLELPPISGALRSIAGDALHRLTPAARGGGRGRSARVSVDGAVRRVARDPRVFRAERDAEAARRVLDFRRAHPGVSDRFVILGAGGDRRANRRAIERLRNRGAFPD